MDDDRVNQGSGNVYADFGHPDAEERLNKAHLAMEINRLIAERGLTLSATAEMLGIDHPTVSMIARGVLIRFSETQLMHFICSLDPKPPANRYS